MACSPVVPLLFQRNPNNVFRYLLIWLAVCVGIALLTPQLAYAQNNSSGASFSVPSSTSTTVGLANAIQFQLKHSNSWDDYEKFMIITSLTGAAKTHPTTRLGYQTLADQIKAWLDQRKPENQTFINRDQADKLRYGYDILSSIVQLTPEVGGILSTTLNGYARLRISELENTIDPSRQALSDIEFADRRTRTIQAVQGLVGDAADVAQNDPELAAVLNPLFVDLAKCDLNCSYSDIQAVHPELPWLPQADSNGSIQLNAQDLETQAQSTADDVRSGTSTDITDLQTVSDFQLANGFPVTNPTVPPGNTDDPDARQARRQLVLDAAESSISAISQLIGLADPRLAHQVQTAGSTTIQVGEAVSKFLQTTEKGADSFAQGLAGVALTGNIIGAAVQVFSLFGDGGPSPDQVILEQIQELSKQIDDLHRDMDARFDRVDASLNNILTVLHDNFAQIAFQLNATANDVHAIQEGLLDLQAQVNRLQQYLFAWTTALSKEQFIQTMNGCLNFKARTGIDMTTDQFFVCENAFYSWAHDTALDQLWAGVSQDQLDFTDPAIFPTLSNFPLSVDLNYLAQFSHVNLLLPALSAVRLANPNEWELGVRAYLQLTSEWPQYAVKINPSRLSDLIQIGQDIRQAAINADGIVPPGTLIPQVNLFAAVANKYAGTLSSLQGAIQDVVNAYTSDPLNRFTDPTTGIKLDLFAGGANQTTSWRPNIAAIQRCDGSGPQLGTPSNLLNSVPGIYAFAQGYLKSGQMDMCINAAQWSAPTRVPPSDPTTACSVIDIQDQGATCSPGCDGPIDIPDDQNNGHLFCYPSHAYTYAKIILDLNLRYQGTSVAVASMTSSQDTIEKDTTYLREVVIGDSSGWVYDPQTTTIDINTAVNQNWDSGVGLKTILNSSSQVTPQPQPQLFSNVAGQIDNLLRPLQQHLYQSIADAFSQVGPVQTFGQHLTGDKLLWQSYLNFGLSRSLQNNDSLRSLANGIPDASSMRADFTQFSKSSIPDTTVNDIAAEQSKANAWNTALSNTVAAQLNQIQQSQLPETLQSVDIALEDATAYSVLQTAGVLSPCDFQLSPATISVGPAAGADAIKVQVFDTCAWSTNTHAAWLAVAANGSGNGTVPYAWGTNPGPTAREAIIIIGDQAFKVTQAGNDGSVSNPMPVIASLNPSATTVGAGAFMLTVSGTNFVPGAVIQWNGTNRSTTFVSNTKLQATISSADVASAGTVKVTVVNPTPGGGSSAAFVFTINDVSPPVSLHITSPADGSTVAKKVTISANVTGNIQQVRFLVDGTLLGAPIQPPYFVTWDSTQVTNGSHTITVTAVDGSGNSVASTEVTVNVNNVDTTPPTVSFKSPADGSSLSGSVAVSANASDDVGVVGVAFTLDNTSLGSELKSPPYSVSLDTTKIANGPHTLSVIARDAAGNVATQSISITVSNNTDFVFTVAPGASSAVQINAGGTAKYTLLGTPTQGFTGQISFTCAGQPQAATCTVAPNPAAVSGVTASSITVTITTTAHSKSSPVPHARPFIPGSIPVNVWNMLLLLTLLLGLLGQLAQAGRRLPRRAVIMLAVLVMATLVVGCGTGGGSGPNSNHPPSPPTSTGTPSGTFTVVITGSSGNVTKTFNLQLTVN